MTDKGFPHPAWKPVTDKELLRQLYKVDALVQKLIKQLNDADDALGSALFEIEERNRLR